MASRCPDVPLQVVREWTAKSYPQFYTQEDIDEANAGRKDTFDLFIKMAMCAHTYPGTRRGRSALSGLRQFAMHELNAWDLNRIAKWVRVSHPEFDAVEALQYAIDNPAFRHNASLAVILAFFWNNGKAGDAIKAAVESRGLKLSKDMRFRVFDFC